MNPSVAATLIPNRARLLSALFLALLLTVSGHARAGPEPCGPALTADGRARVAPFRLFDGLIYTDKPDLAAQGIPRIAIIDRDIWSASQSAGTRLDAARVAKVADAIPRDDAPIVLDFEGFPLTGSDATIRSSLGSLGGILAAFKAAAPGRLYGFYGAPPVRDYWRAVSAPSDEKYRRWQSENDQLAPLEKQVDVLFPSLYTFYPDRSGWALYAKAQICEARRLSRKPVYAFLWPQYHESNKQLGGSLIDAGFWKLQLETVHRYADGVVIWGGWNNAANAPSRWDDKADWWLATQDFAKRIKANPTAP